MLNVAYCRVSTEEQAAEGFSIEGQSESSGPTRSSTTSDP
jgi:DNA invertase Pin-like site-specific DNA recombinase